MEIMLWVVTVLAAIVFGVSGFAKLSSPKEELLLRGFSFVEDFNPAAVRAIGAAELLGAVGLLFPALLGLAGILVPLSAFGLAALMVGAIVIHIRRSEYSNMGINLALLAVALFVGIGRLAVAPMV